MDVADLHIRKDKFSFWKLVKPMHLNFEMKFVLQNLIPVVIFNWHFQWSYLKTGHGSI